MPACLSNPNIDRNLADGAVVVELDEVAVEVEEKVVLGK